MVAIAFVLTTIAVTPAAGQEREKVRLTGAAVISVHTAGQSDGPYLGGPFGGSAPGAVLGFQVPFGPGFSRAIVEIGLERSIQGHQSTRTAFWLTTHKDTTFSGLYAWSKPNTTRVTPTAVGGITLALRHTVREAQLIPNPFVGPTSSRGVIDDHVFGLTGGIDIPVRISSRLFVVPTVRVHWLSGGDRWPDGVVKRGIGPFVTRLGVGLGVPLSK